MGNGLTAASLIAAAMLAAGCGERFEVDACLDRGGSYDHQFARCDRRESRPGLNSACLWAISGSWRIHGHISPGIAAMSDAEARTWHGEVLSIGEARFAFREQDCSSPRFSTREIPRSDFHSEFQTSWEALDLPDKPVCVTEVSCGSSRSFAGFFLIHGENDLLLPWDGIFFKAERR